MDTINQNIFGTRLKMARKIAGMSLQELCDYLNNIVPQKSIIKFEQGLMDP